MLEITAIKIVLRHYINIIVVRYRLTTVAILLLQYHTVYTLTYCICTVHCTIPATVLTAHTAIEYSNIMFTARIDFQNDRRAKKITVCVRVRKVVSR